MASPFVETRKFKEAVALFNKLDPSKLSLLVERVLLKSPPDSKTGRLFAEKEEAKLRDAFDLTQENLETLLNASVYVFDTAAYKNITATKLKAFLEASGVDGTQAMSFAKVWNDHKETFLAKLRSQTLSGTQKLDGVKWRLQLTMGQKELSKSKDLTTIINLSLSSDLEESSKKRKRNFRT